MIRFATDDLAPAERFDHWRDVRGKSLFGVTIELPPERRLAFQGSFRAHAVGRAIASEMRASAYHVSRTEADIARISGDSLCLALQITGAGLLHTRGGQVERVGAGDMTLTHCDLPFAGEPGGHESFHCRMLKIPVDDELTLGHSPHDLFAACTTGSPAFSRPLRALFNALTDEGRGAGDLGADCAWDPGADVTALTRLALAARGRLPAAMPEVRAALRHAQRYAGLEIMQRDKHRWAITPASVALELGISVRQLHLVFEGAGLSFSRTLSALRIEDAKRLLMEFPGLPVTQVAYACGFESLATFYRAFGNACGQAPQELRKAGSAH
jgi:AraC-like DNA-binding protein